LAKICTTATAYLLHLKLNSHCSMPQLVDVIVLPGNIAGVQASCLRKAAEVTTDFSGREIAKLMASVQAAAYGTPNAALSTELFHSVLALKLKQHRMRRSITSLNKDKHLK
jgi:hypothetical protein